MSETQSGRWVGLALGALLLLTFILNAISRSAEANGDVDIGAPITASEK